MAPAALVLIVDDALDNREAYVEYLRFRGFRTLEAGTGSEALALARAHTPDVILLDMRLPDIDGLEVSRVVRADPALRQSKIIAVSAAVFPADVAAALASGCHLFLQKPCLPDALVTEIERLLEPAVT
ncbi:MAG: response regulator [Vicinamibacterales bacterium]